MVRRARREPSPAERLVREGLEIEYPSRRPGRRARPPKTNVDLLQSAIAKYSEAIKLDPSLAQAYIRRAGARRQAGDRKGARADATAAYKLRPREPMDYLLISFPFQYAEQRRILRTGIALARPGSLEHQNLGLSVGYTHWYEGRFDLQLRAMLRLIRDFTKWGKSKLLPSLHYQAGEALMAMGRFGAAETQLRQAFRDRGTHGMLARVSVLESRLYRDDLDGAREVLEEIALRLPADWVPLTRAYLQALGPGPVRIAKALEKRILRSDPATRDDYMGAVILWRLGRKEIAKQRLQRFIGHCEGNPR